VTPSDQLNAFLPILRCPACGSAGGRLALASRQGDFGLDMPLLGEALTCEACGAAFPVTADWIPILWTEDIRGFLSRTESAPSTGGNPTLAANIATYDSISTDYQRYTRQGRTTHGARIANAVRRVCQSAGLGDGPAPGAGLRHLDFGCGPGHVLEWLKPFGFSQVGLDVSLANLRNAREQVGCFVVCGDACRMPFADAAFHLITESSALHHILDWRAALRESCRVCGTQGGIVIDCEPSSMQMAWSRLAIAVFNSRFAIYRVLSHVLRDKYIYRDTTAARRNVEAEIHHQPGTGFPLEELRQLFQGAGYRAETIVSPTPDLGSRATPNWKEAMLDLLSARNPWNPDYGFFTAIATRGPAGTLAG
jgi:ubiquinone/menaquinone biosynthesis C-methylase UbiE/uncharacterized protein YbaR (Trm112 family)